ncbi:hypothetical protein C482_04159 [Natrialba chahannaoensis JCM 10990]|uniref:Uncharacterized protein n=2 Tax=Natrialba chahannaoensis TaxID=68911 RepID=M0B0G6_9EURY|nr:hypothetical protein C482_04159 [Natrialba chahannaoensis JCM 10990]
MADSENTAQSDARSEFVPSDELPTGTATSSPSRSTPASGEGSDGGAEQHQPVEGQSGQSGQSVAPSSASAEPASADAVDPVDPDGTDEVQPADDSPPEHGRVVSEPSGENPSMEELREELNKQFESIKIVRPGQYELNLMELYNREEYIISLQEDGRYVIDVPDSWRDGGEE